MSTWMIVEDEPEIYDVLLAMFQVWGVKGVAFVDSTEALAWIEDVDQGRTRGELPELAVLDIRMPEVSGLDISARLRKSPFLGHIPIVLITAFHMSPEDERAAIAQAQADLLLDKPLPAMPVLRKILNDLIATRRQATGRESVVGGVSKPAPVLRTSVRRSVARPDAAASTNLSAGSRSGVTAPPDAAGSEPLTGTEGA